jgi:hypothetical protein
LTSASSSSANACSGTPGALWCPESVPAVTKPRASGEGRSGCAEGTSPIPVISTPLKPPPPNCR